MRSADLVHRLVDHPFKPFRIHLTDGTIIDVTNPALVMPGVSSAVIATEMTKDDEGNELVKRWRTVSIVHMVQFTDIDEPPKRTRRRRSA